MEWYLYIVRCKDGSFYTGITTSIIRRIKEHNNKIGAKAVRGKLPAVLAYKEEYKTQQEAAKRERGIKGWRKEKKESLINKGLS